MPEISPLVVLHDDNQATTDWENVLRVLPPDFRARKGYRSVVNLIPAPLDFNDPAWSKIESGGGTVTISGDGQSIACVVPAGGRAFMLCSLGSTHLVDAEHRLSCDFSGVTGNPSSQNLTTTTARAKRVLPAAASDGRFSSSLGIETSAGSDALRVGIGCDTAEPAAVSLTATRPQYERVTGQSNKNPSSFVDGAADYSTLNANYVDEATGEVYELVGAEIDQRHQLDGSNTRVSVPTYTTLAGDTISFGIKAKTTAAGMFFDGPDSSSRMYCYFSGGSMISSSGTISVDSTGSAAVDLTDGLDHHIAITGISAGLKVGFIGQDKDGLAHPNDVIYDVKMGKTRHYRLDEQDGTVAVNAVSPGVNDGTLLGHASPPLAHPSVLRGAVLEPDSENSCPNGNGFRSYSDAVATLGAIAPDGTPTAYALTNLQATTGLRAGHVSNTPVSQFTAYAPHLWLRGVPGELIELEVKRASGGSYAGVFLQAILTAEWKKHLIPVFTTVDNDFAQFYINNSAGNSSTADEVDVWQGQLDPGKVHFSTIINNTLTDTLLRDGTLLTEALTSPVANGISVTVEGFWGFDSTDDLGAEKTLIHAKAAGSDDDLEFCLAATGGVSTLYKKNGGATLSNDHDALAFSSGDAFKVVVEADSSGIVITWNDGAADRLDSSALGASWADDLINIAIGSKVDGTDGLPVVIKSASYSYISENGSIYTTQLVDSITSGIISEITSEIVS